MINTVIQIPIVKTSSKKSSLISNIVEDFKSVSATTRRERSIHIGFRWTSLIDFQYIFMCRFTQYAVNLFSMHFRYINAL